VIRSELAFHQAIASLVSKSSSRQTKLARRYDEAPAMALVENVVYCARLETAHGIITIRLRPELAPNAVNSFVFLVREGFYQGTTFHRVITGFLAQGGDPTGNGSGGPGYRISDELSDEPFEVGAVGLANTGPDMNGSQFFITLAPALHLTGRFTLFGNVQEGLDTAFALAPRDPALGDDLPPGDKLLSVQIIESNIDLSDDS
jgi:cyclophilin family peptidyl-prolyl cis-trans isomerase